MGQLKNPKENIKSLTDHVDKEIEADIRKLKRTSSALALMGTVVVLLIVALLIYTINRNDRLNLSNPLVVVAAKADCYESPDPESEKVQTFQAGDELLARDYDQGWYRVNKLNGEGTAEQVGGWVREDNIITRELHDLRVQTIQHMGSPIKILNERISYDPTTGGDFELRGTFRNIIALPLDHVRLLVSFSQRRGDERQNEGPLQLPADVTDDGREAEEFDEVAHKPGTGAEKEIPTMITREEDFFIDNQLPAQGSEPFVFQAQIEDGNIEFKRWDVQLDNYPVQLTYVDNDLVYDDTGYFKLHYTLSNRTDLPLSNIRVKVVFEDPETNTLYVYSQRVCQTIGLKKGVDRSFDFEGLVERTEDEQLAESPLVWKGVRVLAEPIEIYDPRWLADEIGNFTLFAKLRNNTNLPVQNVRVKVNFFDQNRELVDYKSSYFATNKPLVFGEPQEIVFRGTFTRNYRYKSLRVEGFK
ncbi:MAG: hypothetical protein P9M14_18530 [Candidatus Alcyoniella australis]|nr:hypothetical protein [Candidatus Alcyoniella australis]